MKVFLGVWLGLTAITYLVGVAVWFVTNVIGPLIDQAYLWVLSLPEEVRVPMMVPLITLPFALLAVAIHQHDKQIAEEFDAFDEG